ncbi:MULTISPECIES: hypothetical protein [unclassified Burkholderia]|nr:MULTISPECIES: hypothetical protein [unclassified Burkholderia]NIE82432.1 hypothetical protein [Burkholderia sp. Tr-860]NIF61370.1 hypothetical protein [Burkholderia sp. Cy-647]NIF95757.1 hypothetical protein [Burkholderia sp. Ax-1720]
MKSYAGIFEVDRHHRIQSIISSGEGAAARFAHITTTFATGCNMPLNKIQKEAIDSLIGQNKKGADIVQELVANRGAQVRDVQEYLKENKTLQGMLKTIAHRTSDLAGAGDAGSREKLSKEVQAMAKKAIKILQTKAKE